MNEEKKDSVLQESAEYITEKEARAVKELFQKYLKSYKEKESSMTDKEWLEQLFVKEIPQKSKDEASQEAEEIVETIQTYDKNLASVNEAASKGVSSEAWLADKIQEASVGVSVQEFGRRLQGFDDILYTKNAELAEALTVAGDGEIRRVNRNPNLDGILAENLTAKTTELSGFAQGKKIRVDVLQSNNANSVDVRAINLDTGKYQNYQLKYGKDAAHTIKYIEEGNYNNQRIVVPSDQVEEVREYFQKKGSNKTITDHIAIEGVEGKSYTKEELKELARQAQEEGKLPTVDYNDFSTKELAMSIGKNAGAMALQSAAVTAGLTVAKKIFSGEPVDPDELVEVAIRTGSDTAVKTVTAGTLKVAAEKGILTMIPKETPVGMIANIACVGIENVKILGKIISGDLSITKGLDHMKRTTVSMVGGLWGAAKGAALLAAFVPVAGPALATAVSFVGGTIGYFAGSKIGDAAYSAGRKVASAAKTVAKAAWNGVKSVGRAVGGAIRSVGRAIAGLFGF